MTKRLIDLDDELLAEAQRELNTSGSSDTVRAALQHAARAAARARQVQWLREGGLEAMSDPAREPTSGGDRRFLVDTGAAARMRLVDVADRLEPLITGGLEGMCDAEARYGARSPGECRQLRADRRAGYEYWTCR